MNKVFNIEVLKTSPKIKVQDLDSRILIYETRDQQLKKTD